MDGRSEGFRVETAGRRAGWREVSREEVVYSAETRNPDGLSAVDHFFLAVRVFNLTTHQDILFYLERRRRWAPHSGIL